MMESGIRCRVLLGSSDSALAKRLGILLDGLRYEMLHTTSAEGTLDCVESFNPDIMLIDVALSDGSGSDVVSDALMKCPNCDIIMLSDYTSIESMVHALNSGARGFLTKPIDLDHLVGTISNLYERKKLEEQRNIALSTLREREGRLSSILRVAPIGIGAVRNRVFTFASDVLLEMLGYELEEILGKDSKMLYQNAEEYQRVGTVKYEEIRKHGTGEVITQLVKKDGSVIDVLLRSTPIGTDESPDETIFTVLDISEQMRMQENLARGEERLRTLVQSMHDLVFVYNAKNEFTQYYASTENLLYNRPEEFMGRRVSQVLPKEIGREIEKHIDQLRQTGEIQTYDYPLTIDSKEYWFSAKFTMHEDGESVVAVVREITKQKRYQHDLELTQYSMDLASTPIFWISKDARFIYANNEACRYLGYTREELLAMDVGDIGTNFDASKWSESWKELREKGTIESESQHVSKDGRIVDVRIISNLIRYENHEYNFAYIQDITEQKKADEARRNTEEKYRTIFQSAGDAIFILQEDTFVDCNDQMQRIFGYSKAEVVGKKPYQISPETQPDGQKSKEKSIKKIRSALNGNSEFFEWRHRRKDGSLFDVEVRLSKIETRGEPLLLAIVRDITQRIEYQRQLVEERDLAKHLLDIAGVIFVQLDRDGKIIMINRMGAEILGEDARQIIGSNWFDKYVRKEDRADLQLYHQKIVEGAMEGQIFRESPVLTSSGEIRYILWSNIALIDTNSQCYGTLSSGLDISDRKRHEAEMEDARVGLENLVSNIPGGVYSCANDSQWTMYYISDNISEIVGYASSDFINNQIRSYESIILPEDRDHVRTTIEEAIKKDDRFQINYRVLHSDGKVRWVDERGFAVRDSAGNVTHLEGVIIDATRAMDDHESVKYELEKKELLLREIHHRIKNNLQIISSLFYLQSRTVKDEYALQILREGQSRLKLMALIHEVLYKSQALSSVNMKTYLTELVSFLYDTYGINREIIGSVLEIEDIELPIEKAIPCGLIINELVANTFKYAFPENRRGIVTIKLSQKKDGSMQMGIEDNGVGLPKDLKIESASTLGLRMVKSMVEGQMRGSMKIKVKRGTKYIIEFPL